MRKFSYLFTIAMCLASIAGWASPATKNAPLMGAGTDEPVITASVEEIDFGEVLIGYNATKRFIVTGTNLTENLTLTISNDRYNQFSVSPSTLTPEKAALGKMITVTLSPWNPFGGTVLLTLASPGAEDVIIPITSDIDRAEQMPKYNEITAFAGWMSSISGTINFPDAEIPHDPNTPVVRTPAAGNAPGVEASTTQLGIADYSFTIQGDPFFSVLITKGSLISKTCDVKIIYRPLFVGSHQATITFSCSRGQIPVVVKVYGTAVEQPQPGDINGDGHITIGDATGLIDLMLTGDEMPPFADVDNDNVVNIRDITALIDMLINGNN